MTRERKFFLHRDTAVRFQLSLKDSCDAVLHTDYNAEDLARAYAQPRVNGWSVIWTQTPSMGR